LTGILDEEIVYQIGIILTAVVQKDVDTIVDTLLRIGVTQERINRAYFRLEILDFLERYYEVPLQQLNFNKILNELMDLIRNYKLKLPSELIMMARTLVISKGVGKML
jgi:ubiquinone biosynthesis protein